MSKHLFILLPLIGLIAACKESPTSVQSAGQVRFATHVATASPVALPVALPAALPVAPGGSGLFATADSLHLTRARFVLEHLEFKGERETLEVRTAPIVAELDLSSAVHDFALTSLPFGTYTELAFEVHRIDSSDLALVSAGDRAVFADFLPSGGASVILEGTVFQGGAALPFSFRSRVNAEQEQEFHPPLVISASKSVANVTLSIQSAGWFHASDGSLLDPRDAANSSVIDQNIKASIRVFEDENRDGKDD